MASTFLGSTSDGSVRGGSNTSWALARSQTTGSSARTDAFMLAGYGSAGAGDEFTYTIGRGFLEFDTSAIPDTAVILAATLNLYVTNVYLGGSPAADGYCVVCAGTQANNPVTTADFNKAGTVDFGRVKYAAWGANNSTPNAYKTITLNGFGLAAINKTGSTKLALLCSQDFDNSAPASATYNGANIASADTTGTSQDPYLSVTYVDVAVGSIVTTDFFTDTDGTSLANHTPSNGTWQQVVGFSADLQITGNKVQASNANSSAYKHSLAFADGYMEAVFRRAGNSYGTLGLRFTDTSNYYQCVFDAGQNVGDGRVELYKIVAGVQTQLGSTYNSGASWGANDVTVRFAISGTSLTVYVNGVSVITATDSSLSTGNPYLLLAPGTAASNLTVDSVVIVPTGSPGVDTATGTESSSISATSSVISISGSDSATGSDSSAPRALIPSGYPDPTHPAAAAITAGASGKWDDYVRYAPRICKNLDGTLYRDSQGRAYIYYTASGNTAPAGSGRTDGKDCDRVGLMRTVDFQTFEIVSQNAPVLGWGASGSYDQSGSVWDGTDVAATTVLWDGSKFIMYFEGNATSNEAGDNVRLGVATSTDGITWTKDAANPILGYGSAGTKDSGDLYSPAVLKDGSTWKMWYVGHINGSTYGVLYATASAFNGPWTKYDNTVYQFKPTPNVGPSQVWKDPDSGAFHMAYDNYDDVQTVRLAHSPDGITWTDVRQIFSVGGTGTWDAGGVYWTDRVRDGATWITVYTGRSASLVYGIGSVITTTPAGDSATGTEGTSSVNVGVVNLSASDTATGTDTSSLSITSTVVSKSASDTGALSESSSVQANVTFASLSSSDTGHGTDVTFLLTKSGPSSGSIVLNTTIASTLYGSTTLTSAQAGSTSVRTAASTVIS